MTQVHLLLFTGVQVDFTEIDYQANEGAGGVRIVVQKRKENYGTLVLSVQTALDGATTRRPGDQVLPNPAECERLLYNLISH